MSRREFITLAGGATEAWPLAERAVSNQKSTRNSIPQQRDKA